jgi:Fic family protein
VVYRRATAAQERALTVAVEIAKQAQEILEPFAKALRTDLVAESNRLEGYDWTRPSVKHVVEVHRELITAPLHNFMNAMRRDPHLMEALGLYRAYVVADEWVAHEARPREYEIRGLHGVICAGTEGAGRYKSKLNEIAGSEHVPIDPFEVGRAMSELAEWWLAGSPDPVLDATVVHAWLTHIHPFDDGNGRLARLLANLALTRAGYPPLVLRSQSDRGQYLDALAASDDGDILPLYDLFAAVVKRSVKTMSRPDYVHDFVQDRLLATRRQRYEAWFQLATHFTDCLRRAIRARGWEVGFQGYPDLTSFALLCDADSEGNCWYIKVFDPDRTARFLLFFGFHSNAMRDLLQLDRPMPSIFFSVRDLDPTAVHPYRALWDGAEYEIPDELALLPGEPRPVAIRAGYNVETISVEDAAARIAGLLTTEVG